MFSGNVIFPDSRVCQRLFDRRLRLLLNSSYKHLHFIYFGNTCVLGSVSYMLTLGLGFLYKWFIEG